MKVSFSNTQLSALHKHGLIDELDRDLWMRRPCGFAGPAQAAARDVGQDAGTNDVFFRRGQGPRRTAAPGAAGRRAHDQARAGAVGVGGAGAEHA